MKLRRNRAFSLIELIVVIAVMAIIAATIIPSISGTRDAATEQRAIAAAEALNLAQTRYRLENGTGHWDDNGGIDAARYALVQPYLEYGEAYAAFTTRYAPYTFTFQPLVSGHMQKVALAKSGTPVPY
ncbi:MAG: type II secretion system protein [Opitutales bacterium]|jgi:prepilin-type N-terminal cleavage/methylation domain-containing protein